MSFFGSVTDIEPEEYNIAIFNNILLSFLHILAFGIDSLFRPKCNKIIILHDFGTNKPFLKISMNDTSSLWCFIILSNRPTSNLILS